MFGLPSFRIDDSPLTLTQRLPTFEAMMRERYYDKLGCYIQAPVFEAVKALRAKGVYTVSSGWHSGFSVKWRGIPPRWTIVIEEELPAWVEQVAMDSGLEILLHTELCKMWDVSLPESVAGERNERQAKRIFDGFAIKILEHGCS